MMSKSHCICINLGEVDTKHVLVFIAYSLPKAS